MKELLKWVAVLVVAVAFATWGVRVMMRGGFTAGGFGGYPTRTGLEQP